MHDSFFIQTIQLGSPDSERISDSEILFLNIDLGPHITGIEFASLARYELFLNELGIAPIFVTANYRPHLRGTLGLHGGTTVHGKLRYVNFYDVLQGVGRGTDLREPALEHPGDLKKRQVAGKKDYRLLDGSGKTRMYVGYDSITGKLAYVNHIDERGIIRRDWYHFYGFLSSTSYFEPAPRKLIKEVFYRPDGLRAFERFPCKDGSVRYLFWSGDEFSVPERILANDMEFRTWALRGVVDSLEKEKIQIVVDKNKYLLSPAITVKSLSHEKKISVFPVIHSTHVKNSRLPLTSQIKSHYEGVFTNLDKVDRVVVLTERQAGEMRQRFENVPLKVIPHYARHASAAMPKQKFSGQVVYVARYAPEKNHAAAIRAFALAVRRFPDLVFHCYGGGDPEKLRLSEISREAGVEDAVRFHDFKENVLEIYEQADLAILTSREEGFSLVVQEALSQGVPVVSFDIRYGPGDMIQDGYNGFLVPEGDEAALAGRVCEVFSNPTLHKTLSENAIRSINNRFSRAKVAPLWSSLLLGEG